MEYIQNKVSTGTENQMEVGSIAKLTSRKHLLTAHQTSAKCSETV